MSRQKIKKIRNIKIGLLLALVVITAGIAAIASRFNRSHEVPSALGTLRQPALEFTLKDSKGVTHQLSDYRGKVILLHFWASWCPPCLDEIIHWVELATRFKGRPIQLIAVSLDTNWSDALKILPQEKLSPQVVSLLDPSGTLPESYGTFQYPETYFIDSELNKVTKLVGPQDWQSPILNQIIEKILASQKMK